ncbi:TPA: phage tail tape measure protein [Klebsiella pneumoniae]|uniref:phage tail tape measure protein n=1 Tax=Klebsiella TaxID=570 RepID=UPI000B4161EF|nr:MULTISPECIES: phage tail tape measure protein [Klebsiella]MBZ1978869.1 phage tail tape measure protein [Klebsiella pneumoniae]MCI8092446.1 phage tail tape measure protein [Klebsiella pneumoniae]MDH1945446.1 phage tail tape measure protein [Klebsiella pneumoniae]MDK1977690.1 phage tail tape measure protein [Klebsiella sp. K4-154]MDZ0122135.1 phage tail tape measure protein [Klebsiella pneumoniae]
MANRLTTEILINLAGNLTAKARQYGANMSEFARTNQRAMSVVKATTAAAGRGLDALGNRYTTMIAGFAGGAMLRDYAATDRRITRMGLAAEKTKKEMSEMFGGMQDAAIKFRVDDSEVVSAIEKVGTVTGDIDYGYKNRNIIAPSIAASGADGESIGGLFSQFTKFNLSNEKDTLQAMDTLNQLGKEGAFELKDIAERGVKAFSMYAAAGGTGVRGVKDVGVALESAVDATGDTTTASTAVENLIRDLQLPKVVKELRRNGVNVFGKDGKMRSLPTLMEEIAKKSGNKGAETQSARLLGAGFNQDSILLLSSVTSGKGAENLKRYNGVVADGQGIMKDAEYASKDFTSAVTALTTTWKKFANSNLAKPVQELADAINSVDQETVQHWLEIGKNIAIAVGGVIAARKAFQFGKGVWDVLNPNKGKGIPNGIADVFGSGVMPVYVTNWPAGGLGGTGEDKVNDLLDTTADLPGWPGMLARGGLIASKLMGLTDMDPFSDEGRQELLKRVQQNNERSTMWEDIKNFFTSSSSSPAGYQDPSPWASMQPQNQPGYPFLQPPELKGSIEVSVKDDRVQVTSVKVNAPGVTMSASSGVRNMEQQ